MASHEDRKPPINAIIAMVFILLLLMAAGLGYVLSNATVGGSTSTPSGVQVIISSRGLSGFSTFSLGGNTVVEISDHTVEFGASDIKVDGVVVGAIDESTQRVSVTGSRGEVKIEVDGKML